MKLSKEAFQELRNGQLAVSDFWNVVCQEITDNIGSSRASLWTFDAKRESIYCEALYDARDGRFSYGTVLRAKDFPSYFAAILQEAQVVAPDARKHPSTSCFNQLYFEPNDIHSLLDFILIDGVTPIGVLCCEHCGDVKQWTDGDVRYLQAIASILGSTLRTR